MKKLKSIEKPEDKNTAERIFPQSMKPFLEKGYHGASIGERQMLVMGRVLMTDPKIMLLDEPSLGLSPLMVRESFRIIRRINAEERASILLVEQNAKIALGVSEYCYVMENGRVVMNDSSKILMENEDIKEFYLGLSTTTLS
jgi:branched-chain amino acid transport system ATP-binding protein